MSRRRSQFSLDLVRIGLSASAVVGVAITAGDGEIVQPAILNDWHAKLGEDFTNIERAGDRQGGRTLTGEIARLEFQIGIELELLLAILGADNEAETFAGPRALDAIFPKATREVTRSNLLGTDAALEARGREVVDGCLRRRIGARRKDVPRYAVRIGAVERRATDWRSIGARYHVKGLRETRNREVVQISLGKDRPAILIVGIV